MVLPITAERGALGFVVVTRTMPLRRFISNVRKSIKLGVFEE